MTTRPGSCRRFFNFKPGGPTSCRSWMAPAWMASACLVPFCAWPAWGSDEWSCYGHDAGGMRYSPLTEINRQNVSQLKIAWIFHTGDISDGQGARKRSGFETTPVMVDGTLYLTTPFNRVIALD